MEESARGKRRKEEEARRVVAARILISARGSLSCRFREDGPLLQNGKRVTPRGAKNGAGCRTQALCPNHTVLGLGWRGMAAAASRLLRRCTKGPAGRKTAWPITLGPSSSCCEKHEIASRRFGTGTQAFPGSRLRCNHQCSFGPTEAAALRQACLWGVP
ncbi:hypothetical protein VTJ49DRAFT_1049 [Mycothermus thermophilus]|uniref:Uncharacterized protein n=1 Tax=Humicola insolens TaxID=85995 RepID=A0ABR3VDU1_HUMIN